MPKKKVTYDEKKQTSTLYQAKQGEMSKYPTITHQFNNSQAKPLKIEHSVTNKEIPDYGTFPNRHLQLQNYQPIVNSTFTETVEKAKSFMGL